MKKLFRHISTLIHLSIVVTGMSMMILYVYALLSNNNNGWPAGIKETQTKKEAMVLVDIDTLNKQYEFNEIQDSLSVMTVNYEKAQTLEDKEMLSHDRFRALLDLNPTPEVLLAEDISELFLSSSNELNGQQNPTIAAILVRNFEDYVILASTKEKLLVLCFEFDGPDFIPAIVASFEIGKWVDEDGKVEAGLKRIDDKHFKLVGIDGDTTFAWDETSQEFKQDS